MHDGWAVTWWCGGVGKRVTEQDRPKGKPPASGETIIVKNLPYNTNGKELRELFQEFGKIYLTKA